MKVSMTQAQKRALLDSLGGKFFSVTFVKKDGQERQARCKRFENKAFTYGDKSVAQGNPLAHKPEYFTACDIDKEDRWININLDTLKQLKCEGKVYDFT